jgi:microsomal dipeptidase-like Zn-dependent dipeptidase
MLQIPNRIAAAGLVAAAAMAVPAAQQPDAALAARARAIHDRVIALDTHNDIDPANFTGAKNYTQRLDTQVNLPKMIEGGLDASFFIVYVGQPNPAQTPDALTPAGYDRAYRAAIEKFEAVHRLTEDIAPRQIGLALTAADVRRISGEGRKVALIGVENGYPIGTDIRRVKEFYDRGGRYMSLAHNGNNQLSDSNTGERDGYLWNNGLSPLGREVLAEMNRVGIMVDVSHPSKGSMLQAAALSKAPIIASHSAVRALCDVSRNMDDEMLKALAKTNGVVQIVGFSTYIKTQPQGSPRATVADFVNHIDYAVKLIGVDHVGISSDFDGGGGLADWKDASETFNVTLELVRRGYSEADIAKMWSGNLLRVMDDVQRVARELQGASR